MNDKQQRPGAIAPAAGWRPLPRLIRRALMVSASALLAQGLVPDVAVAGPTGGEVVAGKGNIKRPDSRTTRVEQKSRSLAINWNTFDIKADEVVQFNQPSSSSAVLNRVMNQSASQIFGSVRANGQVFILNAGGVVIGKGARVDVGGLFVSSLDISDSDFMQGRYDFKAAPGQEPGAIINRGLIQAASGGSVSLVGGEVRNEGVIVADMGHVNLAAGRTATVDFDGDGLIRFEVGGEVLGNALGAEAAVSNSGEISAEGGQVMLSARTASQVFDSAVNNSGLIRAGSIRRAGGRITLSGTGGRVRNTGLLDASGTRGGEVRMVSDRGVVQHGGARADGSAGDGGLVHLASLDTTLVAGAGITSARSDSARGGRVQVLGERVAVTDTATVDVAGHSGGGIIQVGGGYQGADPSVANATASFIGPQATLSADALVNGPGGSVIVWSEQVSRVHGTLTARAGARGGDGGLIETSSRRDLDVSDISIDASAAAGRGGEWLLDPFNVSIVMGADGADTAIAATPDFAPTGTGAEVANGTINAVLDGGTDVSITTAESGGGGGGAEQGNIVQDSDAPITNSSGGARSLTLYARGDITLSGGVSGSAGNPLSVILDANDSNDSGGVQGTPAAAADGDVTIDSNDILTHGGSFSVVSGTDFVSSAIAIDTTTTDGAGGAVSVVVDGLIAAGVITTSGDTSAADTQGFDAGTITLTAGGGTLDIGGALTATGSAGVGAQAGVDGLGGTVALAGSSIALAADIDASGGGAADGGSVMAGAAIALAAGARSINTGTGGGDITLSGAVTGAEALTLSAGSGDVTVAALGEVGTPLGALEITGATLNASADVIADAIDLDGLTSVAFAGNPVRLRSNTLTLPAAAGSVVGTATLTLEPAAAGDDVSVATGGGDLVLSSALLDALAEGFAEVVIGRSDGSGTVTAASYSFRDGVHLRADAGDVTITGAIDTLGGAVDDASDSITITGDGTSTLLGGNLVTAGAAITIDDSVRLSADGIVIDSTDAGSAAAGAAITITGSVDADDSGSADRGLTLRAGGGNVMTGALGSGGSGELEAGVVIEGNQVTTGAITTSSADSNADGGDITITAAGAVQTGALSASATGGDGAGGAVAVSSSGASVTVSGAVVAAGNGDADGGTVNLSGAGLAVQGIDTRSGASGNRSGGVIDLNNGAGSGVVTLAGDLDSRGSGGGDGGAITVGGNALIDGALTVNSGANGGNVVFAGTLDAANAATGDHGITVTAGSGDVTLGGAAGAGGALEAGLSLSGAQIQTQAITTRAADAGEAAGDVTLNGSAALSVAGDIDAVGDGAGNGGTVTIDSSAGGISLGGIDASGGAGASSGGNISLNTGAGAGGVTLSGDLTTAGTTSGGAIQVGRALALGADLTISTGSSGGSIDLDGDVSGARTLTVTSGGAIDLDGITLGTGGGELRAFEVTGADSVVLGVVNVSGDLASDPGVGIKVNATTSITANGVLTTQGGAGGDLLLVGGGITLNATPVLGASDIVLNAGGDDVTVNVDRIEANTITILANRDIFIQALVDATGAGSDAILTADFDGDGSGGVRIEAAGQVRAGRDVIISGSDLFATGGIAGDAVVVDLDGVSNQVEAARDVTLQTGAGAPAGADIVVDGLVASTGSGVLLFDADDSAGEVRLSVDLDNTGGTLQFADALALGGGNRNLAADLLRFDGTVDGGAADLTASVTNAGNADFNGAVGNVAALDVTGDATVATDVAASGTQTWQGAVVLDGGDANLSGTTVNFQDTVAGGGNALTVTGAADIDAAVSGVSVLRVTGGATIGADVTTTGAQTWQGAAVLDGGAVNLAGTTVNFQDTLGGGNNALTVSGAADFDGAVSAVSTLLVTGGANVAANVTTTGLQTWQGAVVLDGGNPNLTATTVNFQDTVTGGGNDLTITGNADIDDNISGLGALLVTGTAAIAADIAGSGTQTWQMAVTLDGSDPGFTASTVNFQDTVAGGGNDLTITGNADLDNTVSGVANLFITGTTNLGGDVTTTGSQDYDGVVTLSGAGRSVTSSGNDDITFGNDLNGPFGVAVNTGGRTTFAGAVNVTSMVTDAGGDTDIDGGSVVTTGIQVYNDDVAIGQDTTLEGLALTLAPSGSVSTSGNDLSLVFDDIALTTTVNAGGGGVTLDTRSGGRNIDLGSETGGELSLTVAELDNVTAAILRIGAAAGPSNGGISITTALSPAPGVVALRTTGAVDSPGGGSLDVSNLGIDAGGAVTLAGMNDVGPGRLAINAGGPVTFTDVSAIRIGVVDSIVGIDSGAAATTLTATGAVFQEADGDITAASLAVESVNGAVELAAASNTVATLEADAAGAIDFAGQGNLRIGANELSGSNVTIDVTGALDLDGDVEGNTVDLTSGGDLTATAAVIEAVNLDIVSGGVANLNNPAGHVIGTLTGVSEGDLTVVNGAGIDVDFTVNNGNDAAVRTLAGGISGGTIDANDTTLDAASGIGGGLQVTLGGGSGTLDLTTSGLDAAGNITISDVGGAALETSRLNVTTAGGSSQVIVLSNGDGFDYDADVAAGLAGDSLVLAGDTTFTVSPNVAAMSLFAIDGRTTVTAGGSMPGGAGAILFGGTVNASTTPFTVNTSQARFNGDINMGANTLTLASNATRFIGDTDLVADSIVFAGGVGSIDGPGGLTILRNSKNPGATTIGGADSQFSDTNLQALMGFNGTLGIGGTRDMPPAGASQVLDDIVVASALNTVGDVFLVSGGDVTFESGSGRITTPGTVSVLALGRAGEAESGNILDTFAGLSASATTPKVIDAGIVELLASNRIGSENASDGGTLNISAATVSAAQGLDAEAQVDRIGGDGASDSVLSIQAVYAAAVGSSGALAGLFNDAFAGVAGTSELATITISTPKQEEAELGFIDEGVFLLPPAFTNPERAMLMPPLDDPDFPGDQRPLDPDDESGWVAFFEDVVREFIASRYPLADDAGAAERAARERVVTAELQAVIGFYDAVRRRERGMLAAEEAARENESVPLQSDPSGQAPGEATPAGVPPASAVPSAALPLAPEAAPGSGPLTLGYAGESWLRGGIGLDPRAWRRPTDAVAVPAAAPGGRRGAGGVSGS